MLKTFPIKAMKSYEMFRSAPGFRKIITDKKWKLYFPKDLQLLIRTQQHTGYFWNSQISYALVSQHKNENAKKSTSQTF